MIIGFDGLSGTGKSSVGKAVAERLSPHIPAQWVPHEKGYGLNHLRDLLFRYRDEWGIDAIAKEYLRQVFHRQQWHHVISPIVSAGKVCVIDNPCFRMEPIYRDTDFEFVIDLHVIMLCEVSLIPERITKRKSGHYPIIEKHYQPGGKAYRSMDYWRNCVRKSPHVLPIDTTRTTVAEAAEFVIAACKHRFGWTL